MTKHSAMVALISYAKGAFTLSKYAMMESPLVEARMQVLNTLRSNRSGDDSSQKVVQIYLRSKKVTAPQTLLIQAKRLVTESMPSSLIAPLSNFALARHRNNLSKGQNGKDGTQRSSLVHPFHHGDLPPCAIFLVVASCA